MVTLVKLTVSHSMKKDVNWAISFSVDVQVPPKETNLTRHEFEDNERLPLCNFLIDERIEININSTGV